LFIVSDSLENGFVEARMEDIVHKEQPLVLVVVVVDDVARALKG